MVEKILDTEYVGYAYVYPEPDQRGKEYMLSTTPENLANFIGAQGTAVKQIMITDMLDRPIVDARMGMVNDCPDQKLCRELVSHLAPIQMGEKEAGSVLSVNGTWRTNTLPYAAAFQIPEVQNEIQRSPNTVKRAAFAICYYLEYL